jgi:hypothetical protein
MKVDVQDNVYVTGVTSNDIDGKPLNDRNFATVKFSPDGKIEWVRQYSGGPWHCDEPLSLVLDHQGSVYVLGTSCGKTGTALVVMKYTSDGGMAWVRFYEELRGGPDFARTMGIDHNGNVIVAGWKVISDKNGDSEYVTIVYASDGSILCVMEYNGPDEGGDIPTALTVDHLGNVYVTGVSDGPRANRDWATVKYSIHAVRHFKNPLRDED